MADSAISHRGMRLRPWTERYPLVHLIHPSSILFFDDSKLRTWISVRNGLQPWILQKLQKKNIDQHEPFTYHSELPYLTSVLGILQLVVRSWETSTKFWAIYWGVDTSAYIFCYHHYCLESIIIMINLFFTSITIIFIVGFSKHCPLVS